MKHAALSIALLFALFVDTASARPTVFTFTGDGNERWIYAFVPRSDGHLWARRFTGIAWEWKDHGLPPGATSISLPQAVTYVDDTGKRRIYVFALDNNGRLVVRYHKGAGFNWAWAIQGSFSLENGSLAAASFPDDEGVQRIYVFGIRKPGIDVGRTLVANYWNGSSWNWATLATTDATRCFMPYLETTNYIGDDGLRHLDLFCSTGPLIRHSMVAGSFSAVSLGGASDISATAVNFLWNGSRVVYVFTPDFNTDTVKYHIGLAIGDVGKGNPNCCLHRDNNLSSVAYTDGGGDKRMELFLAQDFALYQRAWINGAWQPWADLGHPPDSAPIVGPAALTFWESRVSRQRIYVFGDSNDRLWLNYWDGSTWKWIDQGNP